MPEFDTVENWAQSGAGNSYIFNSVMEADQRSRFTPGDTVIVCWTTIHRDDRYVQGRWHTLGNMFTCPIYDSGYLKTHVDSRGYLIRDLAQIKAVKTLLEHRQVNWKFLSIADIDGDSDVIELYQDVIDSMLPSYQTVLHPEGWPNRQDPHPTPAEHLAYLDAVLPGWVTNDNTRVIMHEQSVSLNKDPKRSGMTKVTRL